MTMIWALFCLKKHHTEVLTFTKQRRSSLGIVEFIWLINEAMTLNKPIKAYHYIVIIFKKNIIIILVTTLFNMN